MKISLRKMPSSEIGGRYLTEFFSPVPLDNKRVVISITFNTWSSRYYSLLSRYVSSPALVNYWRLILTDYYTERIAFRVRILREVVRVTIEDKEFILVPPTYASNRPRITRYAQSVLDESTEFVHFTHFGYLKTEFPSSQIRRILDVFLNNKQRDCEICWDIDEKFLPQMKTLLEAAYARHDIRSSIDTFDSNSFRWNEELVNLRNARANMQRAVRLARNQMTRLNEDDNVGVRRMNFRNRNIGPGAAGTAGEYFALCFLIRGGLVACKAPEGTATYDLLAMEPNATSFVPVQVKTITNATRWLLSARHETAVENLVFCFVRFSDVMTGTRIFFVPTSVVSYVITMANEIYMSLPGRNNEPRRNNPARGINPMRTFELDYSVLIRSVNNPSQYLNVMQRKFIEQHSLGWLDAYENNLALFYPQA
jgi:hypothetical protein